MPGAVATTNSPPAPSSQPAGNDSFLALIRRVYRSERIVAGAEGIWITIRGSKAPPDQGWKLHVSATVLSAEEVLRQVLPILQAEEASFKVATPATLLTLNEGIGALSQIGKFITVYPCDDGQAVRLAVALDEATRDLPGPAIPSDRPLRPGSLVHYRYGGFASTPIQTRERGVHWAIREPGGELVPDERVPYFQAPAWAADPFLTAGVAVVQPQKALIGGRYLITSTLYGSARGSVHTALDTRTLAKRVLKRAAHHGAVGPTGPEARDRLRTEHAVLLALASDDRFPTVYDLIEQNGDLYLVMEDVPGDTLATHVAGLHGRGITVAPDQIIGWGRELASALHRIHQEGYLLCDLKSANVIVSPSTRLRVLDFDIVYRLGSDEAFWRGTRGYIAPEWLRGQPIDVRADVYSLGAVLNFLATGAEPAMAPNDLDLLRRPIALLNPDLPGDLDRAITACLDPEPEARPDSMAEVDALLAAVNVKGRPRRLSPAPAGDPLEMAERLGNSIYRAGRTDSTGMWWPSPQAPAAALASRTLYDGGAGIVLALATLVEALDRTEHRQALAEGARWLSAAPSPQGDPVPGLYNGEAGVALALLRAGQALGEAALLRQAAELGRRIASMPHQGLDLIGGAAGRIRFHLSLWASIGEGEALDAAVEAGDVLLAAAEPIGDGMRWLSDMPPHLLLPGDRPADESTPAWLGYAHGAAGIGDVLLDLWEVTGEHRFRQAAEGAARRLADLAEPALQDGSGVAWHRTEGGRLGGAFWCHGAAGIGRFFLHAARLDLIGQAEELANRAAITVQHSTRCAMPNLCHGLAGNLTFLQKMYRETGNRLYLDGVRAFDRLLQAWLVERDGCLVCAGDGPATFSPAYMTGYSGVAVSLLRLAIPGDLPDLARPLRDTTEKGLDIASPLL